MAFSSYEINKLLTLPLLFQTGYLTIKHAKVSRNRSFYYLDFPNQEVEGAFEAYLLEEYSGVHKENVEIYAIEIADLLEVGNVDETMEKIQCFFANVPYDIQLANEKYYQTIFYIIFRMIGLFIEAESRTNKGRIDAVIQTDDYVYIFEFKVDGSADDALKQIHEKSYYEKYLDSGQEIVLIGANFSTKERCIEKWVSAKVT